MLVTRDVKIVYRDKRGRFSLGKFVDHDMFMVEIADDGVVTLTPMIAMPQKVSEKIDEFLADPTAGVRVTRAMSRNEEILNRG
jgi:hypothetical protein